MSDLCLVFDIDDTLYLERDYVRSGFQAVARWAQRWLNINDFYTPCWNEFQSGRRSTIFDNALAASGIESSPELISGLVELYRTHEPCIQLASDASEFLEQSGSHYPIAVISDGPLTSQSRKADALGLHTMASPIILTEALGKQFRKPHPHAFNEVATRISALHYVYIADNPAKDFEAPHHLGWLTVRVRRPGGLHYSVETHSAGAPDYELPDFTGLAGVLAQACK